MHKAGLLIGWISVGCAVVVAGAFGLFVLLAGPPPSGAPLATNPAFYIATVVPFLGVVGLLLSRRAPVPGVALLGISGPIMALNAFVIGAEVNPLIGISGILMVVAAGLVFAGRSSAVPSD